MRLRFFRLVLAAALLFAAVGATPAAAQGAPDWDIPGGHFFTQTGGGTGKGYAVTDADGIGFWTAFQRLGGVAVVGYPVSQRFEHGGFVTQAMQKAVFQWRPESKSVAFVNVFDDLGAAGKDQFLLEVRQTPKAQPFPEDAGKPFDEVVRIHQAVLDARPAMRAMYFAASNPVLQYGLPTSQVADMGNHYAVRLQRAVIQEWKQDVPWARAGQATVANGGDIAKEAGLFPAPALAASDAGAAATVGAAPAPASGAAPHDGAWGGRTDRNEEITMTVEGNGTVITRLRLTVPTPSSRCAVAYTANFTSTRIPIVGGKARAGSQDGTLEFTATFDSHSSASGTYNFKNFDTSNATYAGTSYNPGSCGSITLAGTWTMRGP